MKKFLASTTVLLAIGLVSPSHAEPRLDPPPPGKAVVYIGRLNAFVGGGSRRDRLSESECGNPSPTNLAPSPAEHGSPNVQLDNLQNAATMA